MSCIISEASPTVTGVTGQARITSLDLAGRSLLGILKDVNLFPVGRPGEG